ncbi:MAG TPA: SRPBCC family protein [Candidatus Limnocylindrales bacterium]|nr:SRPBCC family protein [Candidatus Limnocylindrales bacterium]
MGTTEITAEPGQARIDMQREFAAPRAFVYRAYTDPSLLVQWIGPRRFAMTVDRWDPQNGGAWRYTHRDDAGNEYGFHGVFHGAPSPAGMVQTFEFEGAPGHISLDWVEFEDRGETTVVHTHSVHQSVADRDAMIAAGMASGINEGYERLDELLASQTVAA